MIFFGVNINASRAAKTVPCLDARIFVSTVHRGLPCQLLLVVISYDLFLSVDPYMITKSIWIWKWSYSYESRRTIIKVYNSYMVQIIISHDT
jgi:hypothetical protein